MLKPTPTQDIRKVFCKTEKAKLWTALESHPISILLTDNEFDFVLDAIERSCNNAATKTAELNHIPAYWNYKQFSRLYTAICFRVNCNLHKEASMSNVYLGKAIINFMFKRRFDSVPPKQFMKMTGIRPEIYNELYKKFEVMDMVNPSNVGFMSSEELFPGKNQHIHDEIDLRRNQKIKHKTSSRYKCGKCGDRKTRIEERQTRSFDEAATTFITCLNCGNEWTKG